MHMRWRAEPYDERITHAFFKEKVRLTNLITLLFCPAKESRY